MIQAVGISKNYGKKPVLKDIDFSASRGEITAVLGPNGSGKSTLLRILSGVAKADRGNIYIDDTALTDFSTLNQTLGFYLDSMGIHSAWRIKEQLQILAPLLGKGDYALAQTAKKCELDSFQHLRGRELSIGMKARVGIALSLSSNPSYLVLDEPANGLDPQSLRWLRQILQEKAKSAGAVIFSSHLMSEVEYIADRVVVLFQGKIIWDSSLEDLIRLRSQASVQVEGLNLSALQTELEKREIKHERVGDGLQVYELRREEVGILAHKCGCIITGLYQEQRSLEDIYIEMLEEAKAGRFPEAKTAENGEAQSQVSCVDPGKSTKSSLPVAAADKQPISYPRRRSLRARRQAESLGAYLCSEYRRVKATRSLMWVSLVLAVLSFAMPFPILFSVALLNASESEMMLSAVFSGAALLPYVTALLGCSFVTREFGSGTSRYLYGVWTRREKAVLGKLLAIVFLAVFLAGITIAFGIGGTLAASSESLWAGERGSTILIQAIKVTLAASAFGVIGGSIGLIVRRGQYGVLVLVFLIMIMPFLSAQLLQKSQALAALVDALPLTAANAFIDPLKQVNIISSVALFVWTIGLALAAAVLMRRTDL